MASFDEIFEIHLDELNWIIKKSRFLLSEQKWVKNITESWALVERFVINMLEKFIPPRFKIVSWYIASYENLKRSDQLYQADIIIRDANIMPLIEISAWIEIVSIESVCWIIEVKRTLKAWKTKNINKDSPILKAIDHLDKIVKQSWIQKDDNTNLFPWNTSWRWIDWPYTSNPFIWVIWLQWSKAVGWDITLEQWEKVKDYIKTHDSMIDFIWTLDGSCILPYKAWTISIPHVRSDNLTWEKIWAEYYFCAWSNACSKTNSNWKMNKEIIFKKVIWFILSYLQLTSWKSLTTIWDPKDSYHNKYYLNAHSEN